MAKKDVRRDVGDRVTIPRRCIFCGGKDLTNEDALAKWLSRVIVRPGTRARLEQSEWKGQEVPRLSGWYSGGIDRKVKQACGKCNNGWMSAMEVAARPWLTPMMRGLALTLSAEAQRTVAAWAAKTTFMLQYLRPVQPVPSQYLQWLYTKREPPPDVWIGLAGYAGDDADNPAVHHSGRLLRVPGRAPSTENDRNAVITTLRIYRLVFRVWVWADPPAQQFPMPYPIRLTEFVIPIWPASGFARTWPPAVVFDAPAFARFCEDVG